MNSFTTLVIGCKKHEEIANRFFSLMKKYWPEAMENVFFCTDSSTSLSKDFPTIKPIVEDSGNYCERIKKALDAITSDYVLLLLDDYFLTKRINNESFNEFVNSVQSNSTVYCKLIGLPKSFKKNKNIKGTFYIKEKTHYGISLQPSLWKKESLIEALNMCEGTTAWEVETAFSLYQNEHYNECLVYNKNLLHIKNGVLRGKLFPYTNKILRKNGLEKLNIKRISFLKYVCFLTRLHLSSHMPTFMRKAGKKIGRKFGGEYYTSD